MLVRSSSRIAALALLATLAPIGCSNTAGRVVLTPLTGVRDVIDAPLVGLTNVFDYWAESSSKIPSASAGVSVTPSGVSPGIHFNFSYWIFKPISLVLGSVDWLICRSLWPHWPTGISPWREPDQSWGSIWFPNTRELWRDEAPDAPNPQSPPS